MSIENHVEVDINCSGNLTKNTLYAVVILLIYTISSSIFSKLNFHYLHESGVCMIIGLIVNLIAYFFSPDKEIPQILNFDQQIFFTFILPPIIFSAGYNLKRKSFFKYFIYIFVFGFFGTILNFLVVSPLTYFANSLNFFSISNGMPLKLSLKEILLFTSVISASDTVSALTFIKENDNPKLFAILFGEGIINDAVCIVLYKIITKTDEVAFNTPITIVGSFFYLFLMSFLLGSVVALFCTIFLKWMKYFELNRTQETSIIIFFAYIAYTLTEELGFSPIIAVLFCGIFMSHYAFYNLSFQSREESSVVSKIMSNIAEAFVFTYLGLTMMNYFKRNISISFICWELLFVILGRTLSIFGVAFIMNLFGKCCNINMSFGDKSIMSFTGSIRGAIAFGLAISITEIQNKDNADIIKNTTLALVFFTTLIFGALMPIFVKLFRSTEVKKEIIKPRAETGTFDKEMIQIDYLHPNNIKDSEGLSKEKDQNKLIKRFSFRLYKFWKNFDDNYLKPRLIHNWPNVKDEHEEISKKIKDVISDEKMKKIEVKLRTLPQQPFIPNDKDMIKTQTQSLLNDDLQKK